MITYNLGKGTKSDCPSVLEAEATQAGHTLTHTGEIKGGTVAFIMSKVNTMRGSF